MKKHYQKHCMNLAYAIISISSFLFTTKTFAQETITITPELSKQVVEKYNLKDFKIYPVTLQEVDYKTYDTAQVLTTEYKSELRRLEQYKPAFDEYNNALKANAEKEDAIKTISQNIDTFSSSDEKYEIKEKLLIESQILADKYNIRVAVDDTRLKFQSFLNTPDTKHNTASTPQRQILVYEKDKRSNKNDLRTYKFEISHYKIVEPEKTHNYRMYLEVSNEILQVQKTETGRVLSDKTIKKSAYMIDEKAINLNTLSGTFTKLEKSYMLALADDEDNYIKNELINTRSHYKSNTTTDNYPVIKKSDTGELYYLMSREFLTKLKTFNEEKELFEIIHKLGYKVYQTNEAYYESYYYIKSKTCEIRLDSDSYVAFKQNPSWISDLDNNKLKLSALAKQTIPHSAKLNKYVMQWNIQRSKTSTSTINAWRAATIPAIKLSEQIDKLKEKYSGYYFVTVLDKSDTLSYFEDNVQASRGVLGM